MKKNTQRKIFDFFVKKGFNDFIGVPDSTFSEFIRYGLKKNKVIITTREEEAIGVATGISLARNFSLVFMQNAGFANTLSTIASLVQLYQIPIIFLIGWRGYLKTDAPEHIKIGQIQPKLLKALSLETRIISEKNWRENCQWAFNKITHNKPCALIIRRET